MQAILDFIKNHGRFCAIVAACIAGLLLLWYLIGFASSCSDKRQVNKLRANMNAIGKQLANAQANAEADNIDVAVKTQQYKETANAVLVAANASEQIKANTNAALANLDKTIAANLPVETTATQIEDQLKDLDQ